MEAFAEQWKSSYPECHRDSRNDETPVFQSLLNNIRVASKKINVDDLPELA